MRNVNVSSARIDLICKLKLVDSVLLYHQKSMSNIEKLLQVSFVVISNASGKSGISFEVDWSFVGHVPNLNRTLERVEDRYAQSARGSELQIGHRKRYLLASQK